MGGMSVMILVGFLILWVVINVIRAQKDEAKNNRRQPPPEMKGNNPNHPNNPNAAGPQRTIDRNSSNDIDRFLQEIDRLRQRSAQPKPEEEKVAPPPLPNPQQQPIIRPRPQSQTPRSQTARPQTPRPTPPAAAKPARPPRPRADVARTPSTPPPVPKPKLPVAATVEAAPPPPMPRAEAMWAETAASTAGILTGSLLGAAPATKPKEKTSPVIELLRSLMRKRQGVATALILKEVLDRPRTALRYGAVAPPSIAPHLAPRPPDSMTSEG